ncbi:unnamed protein product [Rotaria sp. Silwood1]|nr:unnamed protein product [Rotaria sp. Silwood1]CAF0743633.1 unnamed protein product [Rotaria sp. Silwood1]CAF0799458.1 unnamed protein product [Rotaria sp. Silwood1]CAF3334538.1 unnamed protein product [Rotaria sp. Silwood1]CAF3350870.1 unnamed protein product [Rotaria sp. Silwood1]
MSTTTTRIKKTVNGGPIMTNGTPSQSSRTTSSESDKRVRKLWWSPKRNQVEIRSEDNKYKHVPAKIGSFANIQYQPGGGQVSIRDEVLQWQSSSKIGSLANANWSPPPPRVTVRTEKLKWDVQPKIGSLNNIDHKPAGGNVAIRDEKIDLNHVAPRVDCGFVD